MIRLSSIALKYILCLLLFSALGSQAQEIEPGLRGRVYDYRNDPVIDAQIWVSRDREVYTTTTNANGKFIIKDIPPGKIVVIAYKKGLSFGGKEGHFLGNEVVDLMLDKSKDLELRIINTRYTEVEGARLKSLMIGHTFTINAEDLVEHGFPSIRSDNEGVMLLPDMPRFGAISVTVTHPDYAEGNLPTFPVGQSRNLVMTDGIKLRGRITNEEGEGVARSRVTLFEARDGHNLKYTEVLSDADGFYTINAPPKRYHLAVRHATYALGTPVLVWLRAGDSEVIADVELPKAHFIHGKTVTSSGDPVPLTVISLRREDGTIYAKAISQRDGTYTLTAPQGKGTLIVTPPTRMMTKTAPRFPVEIKTETNITMGDIVLAPLPEIVGRVIDSEGKAVPDAFVRTRNVIPPIITRSDAEGNFSIQLEKMEIAEVGIYVEHPYRFLRTSLSLDMKNLKPLEVKLKPFQPKLGHMPELSRNDLSDLLGQPAPEWTCQEWLNLPEGKESLSLADYKGKVVVLTLWAAFDLDGATQQRMHEIRYLHRIFQENDNIAFVGIHDAGLTPNEVDLVVRSRTIPYPIGCDAEGFETFQAYRVRQIPQTVIIDQQGNVKYYEVNLRLHTLVKAMLRKR